MVSRQRDGSGGGVGQPTSPEFRPAFYGEEITPPNDVIDVDEVGCHRSSPPGEESGVAPAQTGADAESGWLLY